MKAVLLAGGLGTRLRPLTDRTPKCLVRIGGRPLLDIWLDALDRLGVEEVLVNTHHLAGQVSSHVGRRVGGPRVRLVHEEVLLGSAGTLRANRAHLEDSTFLALNADNLTDLDLATLVSAHEGHRARGLLATWGVFRAPDPRLCGVVETADDGTVVGFEEKPDRPRSELANAGLYVFEPAVLDLVEGPDPVDIGFDLLPRLVGRAAALDIGDAFFADIGSPAALAGAEAGWRGVDVR